MKPLIQHVAFLTQEYPHKLSKGSAGIGNSIRSLSAGLVEKGIKVSIFIYDQAQDLVFAEEGIKFHFIAHKKFKILEWLRYRMYIQNYIEHFVQMDEIDVLEAPDWTGITAFMKFSCPLIIRMHGCDAYFCHLEKRNQKKKNFWLEKIALKGADHLLSVSRYTAEKTASIFKLSKGIHIVPNMVDVEHFRPLEFKVEPETLLYFGSLIRKKGILDLARTFNLVVKDYPEVTLKLIGKDVRDIFENNSTLELFKQELSSEASSKFEYFPEVTYEEIKDHIALAAVVVFPSYAEALPMSWLEAMAMEKAIVASNIGWSSEIMTGGVTGYTVDPRNYSLFSKKIIKLMKDPELSKKMGEAARKEIISNFSAGKIVRQNVQFYQHVLKQD